MMERKSSLLGNGIRGEENTNFEKEEHNLDYIFT